VDKDIGLVLISSVSVVAGVFVALLVGRLESWSAAARSAAAQLRGFQHASLEDRAEGLRAELRCWEVRDDLPIVSSILVDVVVGGSVAATLVIALSTPALTQSAFLLALPSLVLFVLLVLTESLFLIQGMRALTGAPYATFRERP
jgi:hypothetical protein